MGRPPQVEEHRRLGGFVTLASGDKVFVRDQKPKGTSKGIVVMVHGVPASSFLYRKLFPPLLDRGFRAIAFDFPGLGLSDKPAGRDYSWKGLKESMRETLDLLVLTEPVHLVIHDIGGPIAAWYAVEHKARVASITILDTFFDLVHFKKPFPMWTFNYPCLRQTTMATFTAYTFRLAMTKVLGAIEDSTQFTPDDSAAWMYLLKSNGGTKSFYKIMAGFELTQELQHKLVSGLKEGVPLQVVWGAKERSIPKAQLEFLRAELPIQHTMWVSGGHFMQEDCADDLANYIADFAGIARHELTM